MAWEDRLPTQDKNANFMHRQRRRANGISTVRLERPVLFLLHFSLPTVPLSLSQSQLETPLTQTTVTQQSSIGGRDAEDGHAGESDLHRRILDPRDRPSPRSPRLPAAGQLLLPGAMYVSLPIIRADLFCCCCVRISFVRCRGDWNGDRWRNW